MSGIAEAERLELESPAVSSPGGIQAALREAADVGKRLGRALGGLDRGLEKASPDRVTQYEPELRMLHARVEALVVEMRSVRMLTLEMAHFLERWHPIGPSFGPRDGRRLDWTQR